MNEYNNIDSKTLKPIHEGRPFIKNIGVKTIEDNDIDISYLQQDYNDVEDIKERERYIQEDKDRLEKLYNGYWSFIGIRAFAIVYIPIHNNSFNMQTISSSGLWGIESDSDKDYIESIKHGQIDELKGYLKLFNIDIPDNVEVIE